MALWPLSGQYVVVILVLGSLQVLVAMLMLLELRVLKEKFCMMLLLESRCCLAVGHRSHRLVLLPHGLDVGECCTGSVSLLVMGTLDMLFSLMLLGLEVLEERFHMLLLSGRRCCRAPGHGNHMLFLLPHGLALGG